AAGARGAPRVARARAGTARAATPTATAAGGARGAAASARTPARASGTLIARNLGPDDVLDEPLQLRVEELRHPLLVATDPLCELCGLAVADLGGERLDPVVDRDLHVLFAKLLLRIAQVRLSLLRDRCA